MKEEYKEFYEKGRHDVIRFIIDFMPFIQKNVNNLKLPTVHQDKTQHWDLELTNSITGTRIDVKGLKKINRWDSTYNDDNHWVELVGNAGYPGWVRGEAKFIAMECSDCWLLVNRVELHQLAEALTADGKIVYESKMARCNRYQRAKWGNRDETTLVYKREILELPKTKKISKTVYSYTIDETDVVSRFTFPIFQLNSDGKYVIPKSFIESK